MCECKKNTPTQLSKEHTNNNNENGLSLNSLQNNQILLCNISMNEFKDFIQLSVLNAISKIDFNPPKPNNDNEFIDNREVSKLLKISIQTLNNWRKKGIVKSYNIGKRALYKKQEIIESVKSNGRRINE